MRLDHPAHGPSASATAALFLTADKFEDLELVVPWFRLLEAGVAVTVAAPTLDPIEGEHGYSTVPHAAFDDIDPAGYDLLVVPGGFPDGAPATVRDDATAQQILQTFMTEARPVASICHGPWLLASAGVASGRRVTSYWHDGVPEDLRAAGAIWEDSAVVVDGNLVTSHWPPDLPAFCAAMLALVEGTVLVDDASHAFG
ncbi:MAG TPA: type 1 glutamine amidotransferase domain-containing protein [Candidatus Nanopelagicales bacterium]|nr:type 1 glutamine amidotransferase domain-containing protein [Candidatus Nanopelagicales bacterium]